MSSISSGTTSTTGYVVSSDTTGNLVLKTGASDTTAVTINTSQNVGIGTTSPAYKLQVVGSVASTGGSSISVFGKTNSDSISNTLYMQNSDGSKAANFQLGTSGILQTWVYGGSSWVNATTIDSSGNLGIGTSSPLVALEVLRTGNAYGVFRGGNATNAQGVIVGQTQGADGIFYNGYSAGSLIFYTNATERARITSGGRLLINTTNDSPAGANVTGVMIGNNGETQISRDSDTPLFVNRKTNDGTLVAFLQDATTEGTISVSGTTVSYNGGHLSRWAQTTLAKDESIVKGTVLSNLDEMNVYTKDGQPVDNEQLNKVKVSDTEGDVNVAGVFVNWSHDEDHNVDEINMAMTGDMIIRIAQGVTVVRGDLLMSAGDGTAKPQGDDIIRSKTVAKVTSNHVTCTYADGSYCVPCVLMAC